MRKCFFILQVMTVVCLTGLARADLLLYDDFETAGTDDVPCSGVLGGIRDVESDGTGNSGQATGYLGNPTQSNNVQGHSSGDERGMMVTGVDTPIVEGNTGTMFFRFVLNPEGRQVYTWLGITNVDPEVRIDPLDSDNENDADQIVSAGFLCARDNTNDAEGFSIVRIHDWDVDDPDLAPEDILATLSMGVWYDVWIAADNAADTFSVYIQESVVPAGETPGPGELGGTPPDTPTSDPILEDEPFNIPGTDALRGFVGMHPDDPPRPNPNAVGRLAVDDLWWDPTQGVVSRVAKNPMPANGAVLVPTNTDLSWEDPDADEPNVVATFTYDVYFGTDIPDANCDSANPLIVSDADVNTAINGVDFAGPLATDTTYYWRVDVRDPNGGGTPIIRKGKCWSFTTCPAIPVITSDPESVTVDIGGTAVFTVEHSCGADTFQWKKDGVNLSDGGDISGAASDTLTISNVAFADEGDYTVVVSNTNGAAPESAAAELRTCRLIGRWSFDGQNLLDSVQTTEYLPGSGTPIAGAPAHNGSVIASADTGEDYAAGAGVDGGDVYVFAGDPNSNIIEIPDPNYFNFYTRAFTVSAWVKDAATDGFNGIVSKQDECCGAGNGWTLEIDSGNEAVLTVRGGTGTGGGADEAVTVDEWTMITGTFDAAAGQARFYLNGHLTDQDSATVPISNAGPVVFGAEDGDTTGDLLPEVVYAGMLDEVRIYSCALTPTQVATLYTSFTPADDYVCIDGSQTEGFLPNNLGDFDKDGDCQITVLDVALWSERFLDCIRIPTSACGL